MNTASLQAVPLAESEEELLARLCKAGSEPLRLRVLRVLRRDAMDVGELCEVLDVRQPALSHHLKLMSAAGLLVSQRDGNHIFYRRREMAADDEKAGLQQALFAAADALALDAATALRRQQLQERREENSRLFFRTHSDRFLENQDLIAAPERYRLAVESAIEGLATASRRTALEIGPGEGWLLPFLGGHFDRVIALDNAPAMLEAARETVAAAGVNNVECLLGDTKHEHLVGLGADLVVLNMVLHHTPAPAETLAEAASALNATGVLLVTELCEHRQGWARENCGDLWLGFAPEQLEDWAVEAGLRELASSYLGQRNGFTLQLRLFGKHGTGSAGDTGSS